MRGFRANIVKMTMGVFTLRCNRHNGTLHFTSILIGATKFLAKENMSKFNVKFLCYLGLDSLDFNGFIIYICGILL